MPENRFYVEKPLVQNDVIHLDGTEFHHLIHVMRGNVNDEIEVVNGLGEMARARISKIEKKQAILDIDSVIFEPLPQFQMILAQAIPRMNRLDNIIEKGTELGMTKLWLFPGEHSERRKLTDDQLLRMRHVAISAMKQCGRLDLPTIEFMPPLKDLKKSLEFDAFFGDVSPDAPLLINEWQKSPPKAGAIFFIGAETGFSEEEVASLKKLGAKGIKLHGNILRTDTASLVSLAIASHILGS